MTINSIDLYIGAVIIFFLIAGLRAGFLRSLLSLIAVYATVYLSRSFVPSIMKVFSVLSIKDIKSSYAVLYILLFIIIYLAMEFFLMVLKNVINISILGRFDKVLGGIVSIFKALIIVGVFVEIVLMLPLSKDINHSIEYSFLKKIAVQSLKRTYPIAITVVPRVQTFFSDNSADKIKDHTVNIINIASSEAAKVNLNQLMQIPITGEGR